MKQLTYVLMIAAVSTGLAACGGEEQQASPSEAPKVSRVGADDAGSSKQVSGRANIFGAGYTDAPGPAGGGAGVLPPVWQLPAGSNRVVTFPTVTGEVNPILGIADYNGPAGDQGASGTTDVDSWRGISGIVHRRNGMFLVGVFLTDAAPSNPAPPRLDVTMPGKADLLAPRTGQTFLVGDGKGQKYRVPSGATRLFLGFADAYLYRGVPGWYDNNDGYLNVTVDVASD